MEEYGEKILEVRFKQWGIFSLLLSLAVGGLFVFAVFVQWDRLDLTVFDRLLGIGLGGLLICSGIWFYTRDVSKSAVIVYENGIWAKQLKLVDDNFLYWSEVSKVCLDGLGIERSENDGTHIAFIPKDIDKYKAKLTRYSKLRNLGMSSPLLIFVRDRRDVYDISPRVLRDTCNTALENYRKKQLAGDLSSSHSL